MLFVQAECLGGLVYGKVTMCTWFSMGKASEYGFSMSLCILKMLALGEELVKVQFSNENRNY